MPEGKPSGIAYLQREIFLFILGKIHGFGLKGNPLAGIIAEFDTFAVGHTDSFFCAENLVVVQLCAMDTNGAGVLDFLTKQHRKNLVWIDALIIHQPVTDFH